MLGRKTKLSLKHLALQPSGQQPFSLSELNTRSAEARRRTVRLPPKKWTQLISLEIISCRKPTNRKNTYEAWLDAAYCKPANYVGQWALENRCWRRHCPSVSKCDAKAGMPEWSWQGWRWSVAGDGGGQVVVYYVYLIPFRTKRFRGGIWDTSCWHSENAQKNHVGEKERRWD